MKKLMLLAFAALTVLSASTKAPKTPKDTPVPICYPCPDDPTGN
jgi:hypothetical protein